MVMVHSFHGLVGRVRGNKMREGGFSRIIGAVYYVLCCVLCTQGELLLQVHVLVL